MITYLKSRAVADLLNIPYYRLFELLRSKRLTPPAKDTSGDYIWLPEDVERIRTALAAKPSNGGNGDAAQ
jgi:hypothetical protein